MGSAMFRKPKASHSGVNQHSLIECRASWAKKIPGLLRFAVCCIGLPCWCTCCLHFYYQYHSCSACVWFMSYDECTDIMSLWWLIFALVHSPLVGQSLTPRLIVGSVCLTCLPASCGCLNSVFDCYWYFLDADLVVAPVGHVFDLVLTCWKAW